MQYDLFFHEFELNILIREISPGLFIYFPHCNVQVRPEFRENWVKNDALSILCETSNIFINYLLCFLFSRQHCSILAPEIPGGRNSPEIRVQFSFFLGGGLQSYKNKLGGQLVFYFSNRLKKNAKNLYFVRSS